MSDNNMKPSEVHVGDRVKVVDISELTVTSVGDTSFGAVTDSGIKVTRYFDLGSSYCHRKVQLVKRSVPEVLPVGTVVLYTEDQPGERVGPYIQTANGWMDLTNGRKSGDEFVHVGRPALANAVRKGIAKIMFDPTGRL